MEEFEYGIEVIKTLKSIMKSVRRSIGKQFKNSNFTGPQGILIGTLIHCDKMRISELSEKLFLSNSTVSSMIDRIEKQGIIERVRSEEDRRVVYVKITEKFRETAKGEFKKVEKNIEDKMSKATIEERQVILEGLKTLEKVLNRDDKK